MGICPDSESGARRVFANLITPLSLVLRSSPRQQETLQAGDQMVRLASALCQVFDLVILDHDLGTQEYDLTIFFAKTFLKLLDVLTAGVRPRLFASDRELFVAIRISCLQRANGRVRPRLFANVRLAPFHDHRDVAVSGRRRNEIPFTVGRFDFLRLRSPRRQYFWIARIVRGWPAAA
jgi:hypothetical protein